MAFTATVGSGSSPATPPKPGELKDEKAVN
jgi:hypothetical protein